MSLLSVKDLHVTVDDKEILNGINLDVDPGEVHAVMGPNGSGKSTLANILAGKEDYDILSGSINFKNKNLCPGVAGRYFKYVKNVESPKWLQDRLTAIGLRPISALVDITNYITFDLGRPLHVYDADKVSGLSLIHI